MPDQSQLSMTIKVQPVSTPRNSLEPPLCTLFVDDDKLARLGHRVSTAENGKIAVRMIKDSCEDKANALQFDVVFLDKWATLSAPEKSAADRSSQMPLMTVVEVAREVRGMRCPVYIVGCTSDVLRADQEDYIAAGADAILSKPVQQTAILEMIREARKRISRETAAKAF